MKSMMECEEEETEIAVAKRLSRISGPGQRRNNTQIIMKMGDLEQYWCTNRGRLKGRERNASAQSSMSLDLENNYFICCFKHTPLKYYVQERRGTQYRTMRNKYNIKQKINVKKSKRPFDFLPDDIISVSQYLESKAWCIRRTDTRHDNARQYSRYHEEGTKVILSYSSPPIWDLVPRLSRILNVNVKQVTILCSDWIHLNPRVGRCCW